MWTVRLALRRPYTFIVMALLIAIGGVLTIARTPVDIFPEINISVIWQFSGLSPNEVFTHYVDHDGRLIISSRRAISFTGVARRSIAHRADCCRGLAMALRVPTTDFKNPIHVPKEATCRRRCGRSRKAMRPSRRR